MSHETKSLGDRFLADLANAEEPLSQSSIDGYRSLMRRLASRCPKFPVRFPAFKRYLDDTGKATLETMRRRYDFANRFFNSEPVRDLGIPNPCDRIARPGKIVITAVQETGQGAGGVAPLASAAPVAPAAATLTAFGTPPVEGPVVATQPVVDRYLELCRLNDASVNTIKTYARILGLLVEISPTLPLTGTPRLSLGSGQRAAARRGSRGGPRSDLLRARRPRGLQAEHAPSALRCTAGARALQPDHQQGAAALGLGVLNGAAANPRRIGTGDRWAGNRLPPSAQKVMFR